MKNIQEICESFEENQSIMIDSLKLILYGKHEDIFDRVDFYNDEIFKEPLLYAYVNQSDPKWLDSILFGYELSRNHIIDVFPNSQGIIYIPNIGYFHTDNNANTGNLKLSYENNNYILSTNGVSVKYIFENLLFSKQGIEIIKHCHPLFENILNKSNCLIKAISSTELNRIVNNISESISILEACNPNHHRNLITSLKKIIIFSNKDVNSFATINAHNAIFIQENSIMSNSFFVDTLSHEGAHVTFNTITYETKEKLFKCKYNINFAEITGDKNTTGQIYSRFHGLYTFLEITTSLSNMLDATPYSDDSRSEIEGRFAFQLRRFGMALNTFKGVDILEEEGDEWYKLFEAHYNNLKHKFEFLLNKYNLSLGSYIFDYKLFMDANKIDAL